MLLDAGKLTLCTLKEKEERKPGSMPQESLVPGETCFYGERTVGYNRQYAAMGVNERIDMIARIWQNRAARAGMYALLDNGEQYRITFAQQLLDDDGLRVTDLTLERLDKLYDVSEPAAGAG